MGSDAGARQRSWQAPEPVLSGSLEDGTVHVDEDEKSAIA